MASTDSSLFPVRAQAFRFSAVIRSTATGNPITGSLTTPAGSASIDGAAFSATGVTVTEIGTTGYVTVDLTAAVMTGNSIIVKVTAANANALEFAVEIKPAVLTELTEHWLASSVKRLEQGVIQTFGYLMNFTKRHKTTGTVTYYQADGVTEVGTMAVTDDGTYINKGKLS